jgi:hypothetical protein
MEVFHLEIRGTREKAMELSPMLWVDESYGLALWNLVLVSA